MIGSSHPILVTVGEEVILPCRIEPPVNMERKTVEWTRPDLMPPYVYLHKDGRYAHSYTNPLYEQRTTLFHGELSHGNISLKLFRVQLSDEGTYTCSVITPEVTLQRSREIQLRIGNI